MANSTGHWLAVCDYSWACNEALVACKQLGNNNPSECITIIMSLIVLNCNTVIKFWLQFFILYKIQDFGSLQRALKVIIFCAI